MRTLWTVYDQFPGPYLALLSEVGGDAGHGIMVSSDLQALRDELRSRGFKCLGRDPGDARQIIEVWT